MGNGQIIYVNGLHEDYECWQAGVQCEDWLVVAIPRNEISTWIPDGFKKIANGVFPLAIFILKKH